MDRNSPSSNTLTYLAGLSVVDSSEAENLSRRSLATPAPSQSFWGHLANRIKSLVGLK